jgi:hypothetical protein
MDVTMDIGLPAFQAGTLNRFPEAGLKATRIKAVMEMQLSCHLLIRFQLFLPEWDIIKGQFVVMLC